MSSLFQRSTLQAVRQRVLAALAGCVLLGHVLLGLAFFTIADAADLQSKGDIVVVAVHGDVQATMTGITGPLYAGAILQLPATIRSGSDGALELRQGPTTIAAAANTELEIPESAATQGLIERVVQISGNAFYSVGKRERTKLRVETPYLVAVIKGTQFNVASEADATTIALFEGRLEIRAADESDVVDLHAGEIAIRHRNDPSITVLRMTAVSDDARRRPHDAAGEDAPRGTSNPTASDGLSLANRDDSSRQGNEAILAGAAADSNFSELATDDMAAQAVISTGDLDAGIAAVAPQIDLGNAKSALQIDTGLTAMNDSIGADIGIDAGVGGAMIGADIGASVDLGAGDVAANTSASLDLGGISAGVSADAGVDLTGGTIDAAVGAGADAGIAGADLNVGASAGSGSIAATVDAGADLAVATVDAGAGATVDLGSSPAVDLDASLSAGTGAGDLVAAGLNAGVSDTAAGLDATLDVGSVAAVDAGVDLPAGDVSANVDVGGVIGVGVDLGTGTIDLNIGGNDTGGGLLGNLLNRRSKN